MKSRGEKGLLQRRKMVILDHEYIGKETNSLIDPDVEAAGDEDIEDAPNIPIFRRGFNPSLLIGLDLDALSERVGVKPETLRDAFRRGRRLEPRRDETPARLTGNQRRRRGLDCGGRLRAG